MFVWNKITVANSCSFDDAVREDFRLVSEIKEKQKKCLKMFLDCFLGGGNPHMKGVGMLVVSLRGVNFGFWSHLGCSGQNATIFSRKGLF